MNWLNEYGQFMYGLRFGLGATLGFISVVSLIFASAMLLANFIEEK
jgi:hypothetical protein